jgi:hypothetical protein
MKLLPRYLTGLMTLILTIMLLMPLDSVAGTYRGNFRNEYLTDSVYLFLYDEDPDADVIFQSARLNPSSDWFIAEQTDIYLWFSGPAADPKSIKFNITFTDGRAARDMLPFTMEWAEYLNGSFAAPDAFGSLTRSPRANGSGYQWISSDEFSSPVPTPLPASTWLLVSGLLFLAGLRRYNQPASKC